MAAIDRSRLIKSYPQPYLILKILGDIFYIPDKVFRGFPVQKSSFFGKPNRIREMPERNHRLNPPISQNLDNIDIMLHFFFIESPLFRFNTRPFNGYAV